MVPRVENPARSAAVAQSRTSRPGMSGMVDGRPIPMSKAYPLSRAEPSQCLVREAQVDRAGLVQSGPLAGIELDLERIQIVVELGEGPRPDEGGHDSGIE